MKHTAKIATLLNRILRLYSSWLPLNSSTRWRDPILSKIIITPMKNLLLLIASRTETAFTIILTQDFTRRRTKTMCSWQAGHHLW